jgi:hypothetical protein
MGLCVQSACTLLLTPVGLPHDKSRVRPDYTIGDTMMGILHTVDFYLDRYQPTRAFARRVLSPPSALWVKRGESVTRPLPRTRERTTKKRRLSVRASQQVLRDRPEYRRSRRSEDQAG